VGVFIMLVWGGTEFLHRIGLRQPAAAWTFATPVLAACAVLTWLQVGYWRNSETLFSHAVKVTRGNVLAYANLGAALITGGQAEEGRSNLLVCLKLSPGYLPALNGLGVLCLRDGDAVDAGKYFSLVTSRNPSDGMAHFNLGVALAAQGKYPEAAAEYSTAARLTPDSADVRYNHGIALAKMGDVAGATDEFRSALRLKPDYAEVHYWLGEMLSRQGRFTEAVASYHEALRLKPNWPVALGTLAWLLATSPHPEIRNGPEAVRLAEQACHLMKTPDLRYLSALDAAYAEAGRFDEAIRTANRIVQLAVGPAQKTFADETTARLELYRAGRPYHETAPVK
jgi:Flp pilus assembly protein TadD